LSCSLHSDVPSDANTTGKLLRVEWHIPIELCMKTRLTHSNSTNGANTWPKCPGLELVCLSLFSSRHIAWKVGCSLDICFQRFIMLFCPVFQIFLECDCLNERYLSGILFEWIGYIRNFKKTFYFILVYISESLASPKCIVILERLINGLW
jgi:hypothetical protein